MEKIDDAFILKDSEHQARIKWLARLKMALAESANEPLPELPAQ